MENCILVIGGCGFVGVHLSNTLKNKGKVVIVVDIAPRPKQLSPDVLYICCGATNETEMRTIVSTHRPEVIIHLASTGMSGSPMLNPICRVINVEAAAVAVRICLDLNVENLIYTSTYNVVYGGKEILDGNEDNPYFPTESHCDHYAPSKRLAEECVLSANGKSMANGRKLKTCAIRPAAIYGEGEQRHFPRLIKHIDSGLFIFRIGRAVVDWVHVENLVLGFTCALDKLVASDDSAAAAPAGRPYFISDGSPVDNFEFFRPLCQARGCDFPSLTVPTSLMLALGYFLERLYFASSAVGCAIEPFLTRAEVYKVGVSHYFSMDRARRELGYVPAFNSSVGAKRVADHYAFRSKEDNAYFFRGSHLLWYILITFGMSLTYALAYDVIDFQALAAAGTARPGLVGQAIAGSTKFLRFCDSLALTLFSSRRGIKTVFWCATATHVFEAWMAAAQATAIGCSKTVGLWFVQTLILGYPSLSILNERAAFTQQTEMRKGSKVK